MMGKFHDKFIILGHHPNDSEEIKLKKSSLLMMSAPFAIAGLVWGLLYFAYGLNIPGIIPFSYGILSVLSIIHFAKTTKYKFFRNSQVFLILILPFSLQISLGGFIPGSAVIMWALIAPAGALVFYTKKQAMGWFIAFLLLVTIAYLINDKLPEYFNWDIDESFINALFILNIFGVSTIVFLIQYYFVAKQKELKDAIESKNESLEHQTEQLKEMDVVKSRFFANISHEFRTPLTLILGLVNKQINNPEKAPSTKNSETMKRNANRLLQLINQLLDLSKLESGEVKLQTTKADIVAFTRRITFLFESLAINNGVELEFIDKTEAIPDSLYFDPEKLQKILTNLVSNAVKFTPDRGKVSVSVGYPSTIQSSSEMVQINVLNTGSFISEEKLTRVFDRFYQVDGDSTRQHEGTGIGLALVKELVELHRGKVSAESNEHHTIFTILLPIDDPYFEECITMEDIEYEKEIIDEPLSKTEKKNNGTKKENTEFAQIDDHPDSGEPLEILIVEDNPDLRSFIKGILQVDYKVIEAVDGLDGLHKAEEYIPDLILSDVMMPNMDGYELCKQLKTNETTNHIPVILLTAKASRDNKLEGLRTGADDYLIKPFDEKELKVRIKNLITIREKLQKKYQQEVGLKPDDVTVTSIHQKFLSDIKEAIEKNIDNHQFGVDDLGSEIGMSRSQVHRKLKALTDQSATEFIRNYRLYRAADLLKKDSGNITEIAYQVGFSSQTYFSSSFNELFKCSPSDYKSKSEKI